MVEQQAKKSAKTKTSFQPNWPWSPVVAVAMTAFFYLSQYLLAFVILLYPLIRQWDQQQSQQWLSSSVLAQFVFVLMVEAFTIWILWLFLRHHKVTFRDLGWNRGPKWQDIGLALLMLVVYFMVLSVVLGLVTTLIPGINTDQKQQLGFSHVRGTWQLIIAYISLAVLPPIVEETVFRGFLYGSLRKSLTVFQAVLATSFLFAIAHLELGGGAPPLWIAAIDVFILSTALIFLRVKTGSLWSSVMLHCMKNTTAFLVLFIFTLNFL